MGLKRGVETRRLDERTEATERIVADEVRRRAAHDAMVAEHQDYLGARVTINIGKEGEVRLVDGTVTRLSTLKEDKGEKSLFYLVVNSSGSRMNFSIYGNEDKIAKL